MKKQICFLSRLFILFTILSLYACKKNEQVPPENTPVEQEMLKIASSKEQFNKWVEYIINIKLGKVYEYKVEKINFSQKDHFKMVEVFVETNGTRFNFIIGTVFSYVEQPQPSKYVLYPTSIGPTSARMVVLSSGASDISVNLDDKSNYVFTSNGSLNILDLNAIADTGNTNN